LALAEDLQIRVSSQTARSQAEEGARSTAIEAQGLLPANAPVEFQPEGTQFAKPVTVVLPYNPAELAALGVSEQSLEVHYWDAAKGQWQSFESKVDPDLHTVTAQTTHFSLYQVMIGSAAVQRLAPQATPSDTVATAQIACNPLRPSCQPMAFRNLPANARLRIYTLTGALVKDIYTDSQGQASWDGTNQNGAPAASGVYFILAQGSGTKKTIKIGVQR
jgi:hypothetical protein